MALIILSLILPIAILASKSWYHWRYLKEVDHSYKSYVSSHDLSNKMMNHRMPALGGLGMNSPQRIGHAMGGHFWPFFIKSGYKHSALANFYVKVIYWHIALFYITIGLLISFWVWG